MGVVYEASDEKLHRRIALKCALPGHNGRLSPEVLLATQISHPNICKIYEIHTAQTELGPLDFFTMEFLHGLTLNQRLQQKEIGKREAELIALDLCAGLAEAHRHGIIHGDMKPSNVILSRKPDGAQCAVITDFGLARASQHQGVRGGSAGYMAPELHAGEPTTVASDIYALGVILQELVSGFRPDQLKIMAATTMTQSSSHAVAETKEGRLNGRASQAVSQNVPRSRWDRIIRKCLATDPKQRYACVEQIQSALGPSKTRRRVLMIAGAVALSGVAAALRIGGPRCRNKASGWM